MSTVDKRIADQVVGGAYTGEVRAIIRYKNMFDGGDAYKLVYRNQDPLHFIGTIAGTDVTPYWDSKLGLLDTKELLHKALDAWIVS